MIRLPSDFKTARAYDGTSFPSITPGGHICRTRNVDYGQGNFGQDQLTVTYDIVEEGDFKNYFQRIYEARIRSNPNSYWPGVLWLNIENEQGGTDGRFKAFIEAIEASNPGYKFDGDERTLQGKLVGFNFREEEYMPKNSTTGEIKTTVRPFYAISVAKVREGVIPPAKKLYTGPKQQGQAQQPQSSYMPPTPPAPPMGGSAGYDSDDDDDLPF